ncbi:hypothetical protein PA01_13865 [Azoarcus sp. PA01]|nr:hypothetical protein PA01_13865 [Azoarcus sp. PA01]
MRHDDRFHVGALLADLAELRAGGTMALLGDAEVASSGPQWSRSKVVPGSASAGCIDADFGFRRRRGFQSRYRATQPHGALIETVDMSDAELDVTFPEHFFTP